MTEYKIEIKGKPNWYYDELSSIEIPEEFIDSHRYEIAEKIKEWLNIEAKDNVWTIIEVLGILKSRNKTLSFEGYATFYNYRRITLYKKNLNLTLSKLENTIRRV